MSPKATTKTALFTEPTQYKSRITRTQCLRILGLVGEPSQDDITKAYKGLVADITPGAGAKHSKVGAARTLLAEVEMAYSQLSA